MSVFAEPPGTDDGLVIHFQNDKLIFSVLSLLSLVEIIFLPFVAFADHPVLGQFG